SNPFLKLRIEEPRDAPSLGSFELPNRSRRMTRMMSSSWARMPPTIETSERQVQSPYRPVPGAAAMLTAPCSGYIRTPDGRARSVLLRGGQELPVFTFGEQQHQPEAAPSARLLVGGELAPPGLDQASGQVEPHRVLQVLLLEHAARGPEGAI